LSIVGFSLVAALVDSVTAGSAPVCAEQGIALIVATTRKLHNLVVQLVVQKTFRRIPLTFRGMRTILPNQQRGSHLVQVHGSEKPQIQFQTLSDGF
jgi:hypothetical protein